MNRAARKRAARKRTVRPVLYWLAYAQVVALLCLLVTWMMLDAQFEGAATFFWDDISLQHPPGATDEIRRGAHQWNTYGSRLLLLWLIVPTFAASSVVLFVETFTAAKRKLRGIFTVVFLNVCAIAWVNHDRLGWYGRQLQAHEALWRFKLVAEAVNEVWPEKDGELPEAGAYEWDWDWPDTIFLEKMPSYKRSMDFGPTIMRSEANALRFDISGSLFLKIEFHPHGRPESYRVPHWSPWPSRSALTLVRAAQLEECWYLALYKWAE